MDESSSNTEPPDNGGSSKDTSPTPESLSKDYARSPRSPVPRAGTRRPLHYNGARTERDDFSQHINRRTHIGYHMKHRSWNSPSTGRRTCWQKLSSVLASGNQSPVAVTYANYQRFDGVPLPTLVTRQVGDAAVWTSRSKLSSLAQCTPPADFDFQARGGAR